MTFARGKQKTQHKINFRLCTKLLYEGWTHIIFKGTIFIPKQIKNEFINK